MNKPITLDWSSFLSGAKGNLIVLGALALTTYGQYSSFTTHMTDIEREFRQDIKEVKAILTDVDEHIDDYGES